MKTEEEIKNKIKIKDYTIYLDECGAGPLCGDLVICGLVLPKDHKIVGINDSKKISAQKREKLYPEIIKTAIDYCLVYISPSEVDRLNIFRARMEGFKKAIEGITKIKADYAIIDGNKMPINIAIEADCLIKGDEKIEGIGAASIIAKVTRDKQMVEAAKIYPQYGLENHKGYGTKEHLEALKKHGPIDNFHRFSYKPVKNSVKK